MSFILCTLVRPLPLWGITGYYQQFCLGLGSPGATDIKWNKNSTPPSGRQRPIAMHSFSFCNLPPFLVFLPLPSLLSSLFPSWVLLPCPKPCWSSSSTGTLGCGMGVRAPAQRNIKKAGGHMHLPEPLAHLTAFSVALRPPGMDVSRLLLATLLVCLCFLTAYSHLAPEEKPRDERNLKNNSSMNLLDFPSVSIVGK